MKNILAITLLILTFTSKAQSIADTVTIYIENRVEMKIVLADFDQLRDSTDIIASLKKFQDYIPSLKSQLDAKEAELIVYTTDSSITVEKLKKKNIYLIQNGTVLNTGFRDKAIISLKDIQISLTTSDMSNITDISLVDCFTKMVQQLPEKTRFSQSLYYQCKGGELTSLDEKNKTDSNSSDYIELSFGAGASLLRNKWVGDLNFKIGVSIFKKGGLKHKPYISTGLLYDFSSPNKTNINTFLNLGYSWTMHPKSKQKTMGAEFGYLISRQGNAFEKNTFKFGLNWSPADAISVSPQIYFPGGIKNAYPGVRIGFGF